MQITYLGHAGFCLETNSTVIIMDPWLSPHGAFDAAWFQYPKNHHMAEHVRKILNTNKKDKYLYISHEHKDHFDIEFLESIENRDFTLILADFYHPVVKNNLIKRHYQCKEIISLKDSESFYFKDGFLTLFILDVELDCDSAILVKTDSGSFLNLNDCKIHERLAMINKNYGPIDILAGQFSGAVWHPTCFQMDQEKYSIICKNKTLRKFEYISKSIETMKPLMYLPSSGPPCFLDPLLFSINNQEINTYPRARQLIEYLDMHFLDKQIQTQWPELMPGDVLDTQNLKFTYLSPIRIDDKDFKEYVYSYAKQFENFFKQRQIENSKINPQQVFIQLGIELKKRLEKMESVRKYLSTFLYFSLEECNKEIYCVDFQEGTVNITNEVDRAKDFFWITTPAWQINKVFNKEISWPDFALTFRLLIERVPDIYNTLMHGFTTLETESLERFCQVFLNILSKNERIKINYKGKTYSILRYCPHQGGDLSKGWIEDCFLICPRHQWKFDLENHGKCRYNNASIDAFCLNDVNNKKKEN
ncbi:CMP-N-acetylneuraminate monooxygenase [Legionella gratiana]|uniref:CMP-N-acetylneuraminate monooxygenase n=1 Tax=Legionella gratiana TaxID=45066 RepID=A0A378J212_9GAMM|nr:Rieske 2Fe-2S domain-containing protein [Legionella gratiana]KTD14633.1 CMP-N-acetylneuraminate monooxygenase [Legionella gratiana]STX41655.1 Putative Rieske 2Fe-2S iron-sulfur protein MSMEG_6410 [Legionella gratiana]